MIKVKNQIAIFQGKKIRKVIYNNEWWFSVVDVIATLSASANPRNYWKALKFRLKEGGSELVTKFNQLKFLANDNKHCL